MHFCANEAELRGLASDLGQAWAPGDVVLLSGPLGAGKTTFVRGYVEGLGHTEPVRSPTFNLVQVFETRPPVMHADLYRVQGAQGLGLEDYLQTHVCFVEWPEHDGGFFPRASCWQIEITFEDSGRGVQVHPPESQ